MSRVERFAFQSDSTRYVVELPVETTLEMFENLREAKKSAVSPWSFMGNDISAEHLGTMSSSILVLQYLQYCFAGTSLYSTL